MLIVWLGEIQILESAIKIGGKRIVKKQYDEWEKMTPLHIAAYAPKQNRTEIGRILLKNGAKGKIRDNCKETPLHDWVATGDLTICEDIYKQSKSRTTRRNYQGWTPIHSLCFGSKETNEQRAKIAEMIISQRKRLARKRRKKDSSSYCFCSSKKKCTIGRSPIY